MKISEGIPPETVRADGGKIWSAGTLIYSTAGLVILFCWLLWGDFAWAMKDRAVGPVLQLMLKTCHASDFTIGLLMGSLPSLIGMVFCPIISFRSDRHRGPRGRRIPYLLVVTPVAAAAMICLGFSPLLGKALYGALGIHSPGINNLTLWFFGLFWIIFEIGTIAANAIFGALINDVVPRELLGRFFSLMRAVSLLVGIGFNYCIMGRAEACYFWIFVGAGILYGGGFMLMCFKVTEGAYSQIDEPDEEVRGLVASTRTYFRECFSRPYYIWVFVLMTVAVLSFMPVSLFSVVFARSIPVSMDSYGKAFALMLAVSLVLSYPVGALADRFHPLRVTLVVLGLYGIVTLWGGLFISNGHTFLVAFVLNGALAGCFWTCSASLGQRLFPRARFAQFSSAAGLLGALGGILMGPGLGRFLDVTGSVYRYTFLVSAGFAAMALIAGMIVHAGFMNLGGPRHYIAPD